ncbi:MAG: hypothetical protein NW241_07785 [Bacteroidia bacterium]|nr:hypothetical protein [Bacteroidia bacterium]
MVKRTTTIVAVMVVSGLLALGYGHFVYPVNPLIVWALLFFCWLCYRLHLRARRTFAPRRRFLDRHPELNFAVSSDERPDVAGSVPSDASVR